MQLKWLKSKFSAKLILSLKTKPPANRGGRRLVTPFWKKDYWMENKIAYKAFASPQAFVKSSLVIVVCFLLQDNEKDLVHKNW